MKVAPVPAIQELAQAILDDSVSSGCNFLRGLTVFYGGRPLEREEITSAFYVIRSDTALMRRLHETEVRVNLPVRTVLELTLAYLGQLYQEHTKMFPEGDNDGHTDD